MKKALVISFLLVAGLGLAAFAGPLSGSWEISMKFEDALVDQSPSHNNLNVLAVTSFDSILTLDYTTCGWTFGSTAIFDKYDFENLFFTAEGSVGAFGFFAGIDFNPQSTSFKNMVAAVNLSIAGVTVYGIGVVNNFAYNTSLTDPEIGIGYVLGGYGVAGDCSVYVEAQWNMKSKLSTVYGYGYDYLIDNLFVYDWCDGWSKGLSTVQSTCNAAWSGLDIYVEYPFSCATVLTKVNFDCAQGFDYICFEIDDISLGTNLDWLLLDDLNICFGVNYKQVCADIDLVIGDTVCFTPYLSLDMDPTGTIINGIALNAVTVDWDMGQGVVFKAGDILNRTFSSFRSDDDSNITYVSNYCFQYDGTLVSYGDATSVAAGWAYSAAGMCCYNTAYNEFIGLEIDGDACCGGAFDVGIYNWFTSVAQGSAAAVGGTLFDWQETTASLAVGIGSNTTLKTSLSLHNAGLNWIKVGAKFTF